MSAVSLFELALQSHRAGELERAVQLYRGVLEREPEHGDALLLLSMLARQAGALGDAASLLERAVRSAPHNAPYLSNLGDVYRAQGRNDEAFNVLLLAVARAPDFAEAVFNLAHTCEERAEWAAAEACYERARELDPDLPVAERLAVVREKSAAGSVSSRAKRAADPSLSAGDGLAALAETLRLAGRVDDAAIWYHVALKVNPRLPNAFTGLGAMDAHAGRFDEAIVNFRRALEIDQNFHVARGYLATALDETGLIDEAQQIYRQAVAQFPGDPVTHSTLLFNMPFWPNVSPEEILSESRSWNARHAQPLAAHARPLENERSPARRLRIGYVSPDFRTHVQSLFTVPLLRYHNHEQFEIVCYSSVQAPDELTERIRSYADVFREVGNLDDAALAELVRRDRVDVLVDLTMHMTDRRLLAFARRPAPVQLCWLAYPGTTGLETMDYRVSDPYLDPAGARREPYTEETVRLPDSFWCYDPLTDALEPNSLPALRAGAVTFGCLNHFRKVNSGVLRVWAKVLAALPESRLLLLAPAGSARNRVRSTFEQDGVAGDRIEFVDRGGRLDYLRRYHEIDLCLDTFPSNGHTTSLDAWWMGVPTVTLAGETVVGRAGVCQAMNLGLPELIANSSEEYVRIASALANDLERLRGLRSTLRERLQRSPLMDGPRFARHFEALYREIWHRFCAKA